MDSRYAPRDDHREINRQASRDRDRDTLPPNKETYNKRRYDDSYLASRRREEAKKEERKLASASNSSKEERTFEASRGKQPTRSAASSKSERDAGGPPPPAPQPEPPQPAKQIISSSSPEHVRERPFRLNLQMNLTSDGKLKGKVGDVGDSSESVSSAKKSFDFSGGAKRSPTNIQPRKLSVSSKKIQTKSWYEMTLEEEEEMKNTDTGEKISTQEEETVVEQIDDPNEDKILEEEDWMNDGEAFDVDEDDLMDEAEFLFEEETKDTEADQERGLKPRSQVAEKSIGEEEPMKPLKDSESVEQRGGDMITSGPNREQRSRSPSIPPKSPFKRLKKGSQSPNAAGLSLRKKNLLKRASPKIKGIKSGPTMGSKSAMGRAEKNITEGSEEEGMTSKNKNVKVGIKPPKVPK